MKNVSAVSIEMANEIRKVPVQSMRYSFHEAIIFIHIDLMQFYFVLNSNAHSC